MTKEPRRQRSKPLTAAGDLDDCEEHREALLDEALVESFPASDPPSIARPPAKGC